MPYALKWGQQERKRERIAPHMVKELLVFIRHECSLSFSQEPTSDSFPVSFIQSTSPHPLHMHFNISLQSTSRSFKWLLSFRFLYVSWRQWLIITSCCHRFWRKQPNVESYIFWDVAPSSPLKVIATNFTLISTLAHSCTLKMEGKIFLRNIRWLSTDYRALYPRR
jgi:hypothetical protein